MNIAKKLLFSLLLCGTVFAAACGDDGKTAGKGEDCSSSISCDTGLSCVAKTDNAETGTCEETCSATNCASPKTCKPDTKKVKGATEAPQVCTAPGGGGGKSGDGGPCSASSGKTCNDGYVCVSDVCQPSCTTLGNNDTVCKAHDTKKECVEEDSKKFCKAPVVKQGEDAGCSDQKPCKDNLSCVNNFCQPTCTTVGMTDTVCQAHGSKKECVEENQVKFCKVPAPKAKAVDDPCTTTSECNSPKLACINDGGTKTCQTVCTVATASTDCKAPKANCATTESDTTENTKVHICIN